MHSARYFYFGAYTILKLERGLTPGHGSLLAGTALRKPLSPRHLDQILIKQLASLYLRDR
jgi:hypothetical protein